MNVSPFSQIAWVFRRFHRIMIAVCIARDDGPISTQIECLSRDCLDKCLTHVPACAINIPYILSILIAEHVCCYIFAGSFERTFFLLIEERSVGFSSFKNDGHSGMSPLPLLRYTANTGVIISCQPLQKVHLHISLLCCCKRLARICHCLWGICTCHPSQRVF